MFNFMGGGNPESQLKMFRALVSQLDDQTLINAKAETVKLFNEELKKRNVNQENESDE